MAQKRGQQTADLAGWYSELNRAGQKQEYDKAVKLCGRILHHFPKEVKAYQYRVVCFMLQDKFEEALTAIGKDKERAETLQFERAYCEYRLNRTQQALATLRSIPDPNVRTKELLAQVLYRLEEYEECYDLYKDLLKNTQDDFDLERETNMAAVVASLQMWGVRDVEGAGLEEDTYEKCYNSACYMIGRRKMEAAQAKLKKAEEFLRSDTDLTEEEVEDELAIVRVQMGYLLQCQGHTEEASQLYNLVQKNRPSDSGTCAVLSNNIVTVNREQNVFDSKRKMKAATVDSVKAKLTAPQRETIAVNQCLLHMYSNQGEQCLKESEALLKQNPGLKSCMLISAAQHVKDKNMDKAIAIVQAYADTHPEERVNLQLTMVQIYLSQGKVYPACDTLKALGQLHYKPGVVSALVTLYMSQEDAVAASETLIGAVNWYKKNQPQSGELAVLTQANSAFQMKHGNSQVAAQMLEDQRKRNPKDPLILAQLISAYSQFDTAKAKEISKDLPPVSEIAQGVDVAGLESTFSTLGPKYMKKTLKAGGEASPGPSGDVPLKKKKKKKKGKLPKSNIDIGDLDPERWLPRRERSYFRGKRKDKRKDIGKGTQGSGMVSADLDASKPSPGGSSDPSSPRPGSATSTPSAGSSAAAATSTASPQAAGPRQQKPAQAQKKKKKKGGSKW